MGDIFRFTKGGNQVENIPSETWKFRILYTYKSTLMSKKVLLISEKQIKDQSIIEQNVDSKVLVKTIQMVQEIQLKAVLGSSLYDSILDAVQEFAVNATPLTDLQLTMLNDYIQPFIIHATLVDFIIVNNFKITNKGTLKMKDDVADNVSAEDLQNAKNFYEQYKSEYKKSLVEFLKDNNLVESYSVDTDTTSAATGWYLD